MSRLTQSVAILLIMDCEFSTLEFERGLLTDLNSTGADMKNLPVTVTSGSAVFKAALRVRVQAGTTVEVFGTGFDFEAAVFADLM